MKSTRAIVGAIAAASLFLTACSDDGGADAAPDEVRIGIVNLVSHPALDAAQDGFIEGLAEAGHPPTGGEGAGEPAAGTGATNRGTMRG